MTDARRGPKIIFLWALAAPLYSSSPLLLLVIVLLHGRGAGDDDVDTTTVSVVVIQLWYGLGTVTGVSPALRHRWNKISILSHALRTILLAQSQMIMARPLRGNGTNRQMDGQNTAEGDVCYPVVVVGGG